MCEGDEVSGNDERVGTGQRGRSRGGKGCKCTPTFSLGVHCTPTFPGEKLSI